MKKWIACLGIISSTILAYGQSNYVVVANGKGESYEVKPLPHKIYVRSCGYDNHLKGLCSSSRIQTTYEDQSIPRGWSVMVLNPKTLVKKDFRSYDTHGTQSLSTTMGQYLDTIATGDLVIIGTYDQPAYITDSFISSMGRNLNADTAALQSIKLTSPNVDDVRYRSSYAIISYKGGVKVSEELNYRHTDTYLTEYVEEK